MNTSKMSYNEMKKVVSEKGIEVENFKKETLIAALASVEVEETEKRGRPIDPNSARQKRLARVGKVKRGRPVDPNSAWNKKQQELETKRAAGELKQGRPVDPNSARQKRLAEKQAKIDAGIEISRGRPANTDSEEAKAE
jgi:ribosomal protein L12E/L44/L45/RPP1/RPP2